MLLNFRIMQKNDRSIRKYQNLKTTHADRQMYFLGHIALKMGYATFC